MKNNMPAKFPTYEITQLRPKSRMLIRRCRKAADMNIILLVNRSAPLSTIITRPTGKNTAPSDQIRPGAFSGYHGAASVDRHTAQPNPSRGPVMHELKNSLSSLM